MLLKKATDFMKKSFKDMKESAQLQHEVDKAEFQAAKAKSKADFAEAKKFSQSFQTRIREEREEKLRTAKTSIAESERRCEETESN